MLFLGGSSTWARTKDLRIMYPQNMSSVNQVAIPKRGYRWGYKFYLKVKNALFIWLFRLLSIDASQYRKNRPLGVGFFAYNPMSVRLQVINAKIPA